MLVGGNAQAELWEMGGRVYRYQVGSPDPVAIDERTEENGGVDDSWGGFQWDDESAPVYPGDELEKKPYIVNTGDTPVVVKMEGEFSVKDKDGELITWEQMQEAFDGTGGSMEEDLINYIKFPDNTRWVGTSFEKVDGSDVVLYKGTWYYTDANNNGKLGIVATNDPDLDAQLSFEHVPGQNNATTPVFDRIVVPDELGNNADGYTLDFQLTGYVLQYTPKLESKIEGGMGAWAQLAWAGK